MSQFALRCAVLFAALVVASTPAANAAEPSAEDTEAIEALQSQGVDLSEPQLVEFMFSFQLAQQARQFGSSLASEGFRSTVERGDDDVLLLARKRLVLSTEGIAALRERFETLAKSAGGRYEGWGVP